MTNTIEKLGSPDLLEYTTEEKERIIACKGEHEFYIKGKMEGALKYCKKCKFGYTVYEK